MADSRYYGPPCNRAVFHHHRYSLVGSAGFSSHCFAGGRYLGSDRSVRFPRSTVYFGDTDDRRVFHLVLFLRACVHVDQRRREGKKLIYKTSEDNQS